MELWYYLCAHAVGEVNPPILSQLKQGTQTCERWKADIFIFRGSASISAVMLYSKYMYVLYRVCEDRWELPPLQAWMMMILGLFTSAGQFFAFKCWKISSVLNALLSVPEIIPMSPWDMMVTNTLSVWVSFLCCENWVRASSICCGNKI